MVEGLLSRGPTLSSFNIIYMIECNKNYCHSRNIGETMISLKHRLADHHGYIVNIGTHYNLPGHSLANLKVTILEKVKYNDDNYRKERESIS